MAAKVSELPEFAVCVTELHNRRSLVTIGFVDRVHVKLVELCNRDTSGSDAVFSSASSKLKQKLHTYEHNQKTPLI